MKDVVEDDVAMTRSSDMASALADRVDPNGGAGNRPTFACTPRGQVQAKSKGKKQMVCVRRSSAVPQVNFVHRGLAAVQVNFAGHA